MPLLFSMGIQGALVEVSTLFARRRTVVRFLGRRVHCVPAGSSPFLV